MPKNGDADASMGDYSARGRLLLTVMLTFWGRTFTTPPTPDLLLLLGAPPFVGSERLPQHLHLQRPLEQDFGILVDEDEEEDVVEAASLGGFFLDKPGEAADGGPPRSSQPTAN